MKLSKTSIYHYVKLVFHSVMFLAVLIFYIINKVKGSIDMSNKVAYTQVVLVVMWIVFTFEMIFRFFPATIESMGCQKIFKRNYVPKNEEKKIKPKTIGFKRTLAVALSWIVLNSIIGVLYFCGVFDAGVLILISLAYAVCDMICVLFFCPFQTWFMKNKCCNTCRIYNWDYAMIATPLVFIPNFFTVSLVLISLALLVRWEIAYKLHKERFAENTNKNLMCSNCKEKLCQHKKQLQSFLKKCKSFYEEKLAIVGASKQEEQTKQEDTENNTI